jgi:hypothetical protein
MPIDVNGIWQQILASAATQGGTTWDSIKKSAPLYTKGYAQNLADIASGLAAGEITKADADMYVKNANLLLVMGVANTSHIVFDAVQKFFDSVIAISKTSINAALPVAIL